jgi:hypothetical protein
MRAYSPGGRFDSDFETDDILVGVDTDLKNPVGTFADWWIYDSVNTVVDPIYDVGQDITATVGGRVWVGPNKLPVVRSVIKQGQVKTSQLGYYNSDFLHLTFNIEDVAKIAPNIINAPDKQNKDRVVWRGQVYRPYGVQQRGIVSERYTLLVVECIQVMPEEMVNDPQFAAYAN